MAPTPPSVESPGSGADATQLQRHGSPDKIRRNVACINCRDSKVRCRASSIPGTCQRCTKLRLSCVYDKSHRRVTKRSKLELLEQELQSIKQAVNTGTTTVEAPWSPPTPRPSNSMFPGQVVTAATRASTQPPPRPIPEPVLAPRNPPAPRFEKLRPTASRVLGSVVLSGEDVDWYFNKYLSCFHPYLPVLRKQDPDDCYQANPTLFWAVIYVASRRYAKDQHNFSSLIDNLTRDIGAIMTRASIDLEAIHAMLLICAWPFPTIRFICDPSTTMINVALTACMLLGLHLGHESHPEFCVGGRQYMLYTAEEAANTWISCCILAQKISSGSGLPPPYLQHNDARCKSILEDRLSSELMTLFDLQKFVNRLHTAMSGHAVAHGGVFESIVKEWEAEFDSLKPMVARVDTDCSRFMLLSAQLEVQSYYFNAPPGAAPPSLQLNTNRTWNTARSIVNLALALESSSKFLTHGPHWIYRAVVDASCILISTLHSEYAPNIPADEANAIAQQVNTAGQYCIVRDGDLPCRGTLIIEAFWAIRNIVPKAHWPALSSSSRIGGAVTFSVLNRFKEALQKAQKSTECVSKGLEAFRPEPATNETSSSVAAHDPVLAAGLDPFQDVDWSMFMDDCGWAVDGPIFLGPA